MLSSLLTPAGATPHSLMAVVLPAGQSQGGFLTQLQLSVPVKSWTVSAPSSDVSQCAEYCQPGNEGFIALVYLALHMSDLGVQP